MVSWIAWQLHWPCDLWKKLDLAREKQHATSISTILRSFLTICQMTEVLTPNVYRTDWFHTSKADATGSRTLVRNNNYGHARVLCLENFWVLFSCDPWWRIAANSWEFSAFSAWFFAQLSHKFPHLFEKSGPFQKSRPWVFCPPPPPPLDGLGHQTTLQAWLSWLHSLAEICSPSSFFAIVVVGT